MPFPRFSKPLQKVWRHGPDRTVPVGDIVWFFCSTRNGIDQECLTGVVLACKVVTVDVKKEDGEPATIYYLQRGAELWKVDASRVFETWWECDREARIFARWNRQLRRDNA